jgi:hypothetical protein
MRKILRTLLNLYVASTNGHSVLKVSFGSEIIQSTFVAPGAGGLEFPHGLAFGLDGHLYVTSGISRSLCCGTTGQTASLWTSLLLIHKARALQRT